MSKDRQEGVTRGGTPLLFILLVVNRWEDKRAIDERLPPSEGSRVGACLYGPCAEPLYVPIRTLFSADYVKNGAVRMGPDFAIWQQVSQSYNNLYSNLYYW